MLSYEDCVGLSVLTPEEIATIARHEHVPDIIAVEMGACLCGTAEGKQLIRQMMFEEIENACSRRDTRTAGKLGLVLHHFIETHLDQHGSTESSGTAETAPAWLRDRVDAYLTAMLRHFGIERASAEKRFFWEMKAAEMCCAACPQAKCCRGFLAGRVEAGTPSAFCPNASLFHELGRSLRSQNAMSPEAA